jgi:hypothetical protein
VTRSAKRFPIRFDAWYRALSTALFLRPASSYVDVSDAAVHVQMGWAFSASFARSAVVATERLAAAPLSLGVHGFGGRWLVNGASDRILAIDLEPVQSARVLGIPVRLRQLLVSVDDPAALAERLRGT